MRRIPRRKSMHSLFSIPERFGSGALMRIWRLIVKLSLKTFDHDRIGIFLAFSHVVASINQSYFIRSINTPLAIARTCFHYYLHNLQSSYYKQLRTMCSTHNSINSNLPRVTYQWNNHHEHTRSRKQLVFFFFFASSFILDARTSHSLNTNGAIWQ